MYSYLILIGITTRIQKTNLYSLVNMMVPKRDIGQNINP